MQVTVIFGEGEQGGKSLNVDPLIPSELVDWPAKIFSDKKLFKPVGVYQRLKNAIQ